MIQCIKSCIRACSYNVRSYKTGVFVAVIQGGKQEHVFSEVTVTDSSIVSLSSLILLVLKPFPEKGTQQNNIFQRKARGMHAGNTPEEKERALAVVSDESILQEGGGGGGERLSLYHTFVSVWVMFV